MPHKVCSDHGKPLLRANQCLNGRPFALNALLLRCRLVLGQFFDLGIDIRLIVIGKLNARQTTFVIVWDCGAIFHRPADVVNVDVFAENRGCVHVVFLDRCSGETR